MNNLIDYMGACGLPFDGDPILDGSYHRYSSRPEKPSEKDEWYCYVIKDGKPLVFFGSKRASIGSPTYCYDESGRFIISEDEKQQYRETARLFLEKKRAERERAEAEVNRLIGALPLADPEHPYLKKKRVLPHGIQQDGDRLFIPIRDAMGSAIGAEYIDSLGNKRGFPGGTKEGGSFTIGRHTDRIFLCEGFATAATIHEITGSCTACCFGSGNAILLGKHLKSKFPSCSIEFCADTGSDGLIKRWNEEVNCSVHVPAFTEEESRLFEKPTNLDFNDLAMIRTKKEMMAMFKRSYVSEGFWDHLNRDKPPFTWVIENLLSEGSANMLYAGEGVGKSMVAFHLAFCLATGQSFLTKNVPVKKRVLYIDGEMGGDEIDERIEDIIKRFNFDNPSEENFIAPRDEDFRILSIDKLFQDGEEPIDLFTANSHAMLDKEIENADVIIFDHLFGLTICGDTGEDSLLDAKSWTKINEWFKRLKNRRKTILFVHHENKGHDAHGSRTIKTNALTIIRLKPAPFEDNPNSHLMIDFEIEKGRHIKGPDRKTRRFVLHPELCHKLYKGKFRDGWVVAAGKNLNNKDYKELILGV